MDTQTNTAADSLAEILHALRGIRAPIQQGEYDLHDLVRAALVESGIPCAHEVPLAPRCRIDLVCPGGIGIEIKRGQPDRKRIVMQLTRYAACGQISSLILVTERTVAVPNVIHGKPVSCVCLNRLCGILEVQLASRQMMVSCMLLELITGISLARSMKATEAVCRYSFPWG